MLSLWGSYRSHWFLVVHQAHPRLSGSLAGPPRLVAWGEEGSVAAALWPFLCPAVCSAGSTIQYFGADQQGKIILLYSTPLTFLSEKATLLKKISANLDSLVFKNGLY